MHVLHRFLFGFICIFVIPLYASISDELSSKLSDLKRGAKNKSVRIECQEDSYWNYFYEPDSVSGQGFFVGKEGYVLTAKHVIEDPTLPAYFVIWVDDQDVLHRLNAKLVSEHPYCDVALLKVEHPEGKNFPYFDFDPSRVQMESWIFLGYRDIRNERYILRGGRVNELYISYRNPHESIIRASIRSCPGDSGSPCMLLNGKAIAVNNGNNGNYNYCTPYSAFREWLAEVSELSRPK